MFLNTGTFCLQWTRIKETAIQPVYLFAYLFRKLYRKEDMLNYSISFIDLDVDRGRMCKIYLMYYICYHSEGEKFDWNRINSNELCMEKIEWISANGLHSVPCYRFLLKMTKSIDDDRNQINKEHEIINRFTTRENENVQIKWWKISPPSRLR